MTKQEALNYINNLNDDVDIDVKVNNDEYILSSDVEKLGVSRQLLYYWTKQNYVKVVSRGKQNRYSKLDILRMKKN